jgi:hypothetical protein
VRQTNFSAGELDPQLQGRTDLPIYGSGLRTCLNFIITKSGAAMSRPGSTFVAECKVLEEAAADIPARPVRLVPFVAGDEASCVLEFGDHYIRFHSLGRTVESPPGTAYELTAYTDADGVAQALPFEASTLEQLRFAQVGDVLTLAHALYPAIELRRRSATDWEAVEVSFARYEPWFRDVDLPTGHQRTTGFALVDGTGTSPDAHPLPSQDSDHPEQEWQWMVTAIVRELATGVLYETKGDLIVEQFSTPLNTDPNVDGDDYDTTVAPLDTNMWALYADQPITLRRAHSLFFPTTPAGFDTAAIVAYNIYRGRGGLFGFVGQTKTREFLDVGSSPDYAVQPPLGTNPFEVQTTVGVADPTIETMRPRTVAFFEQRRVWGGAGVVGNVTLQQRGVLFCSATGDYRNHDSRLAQHVSGEALVFEFAAQKREDIVHIVTRDRLVVLTGASAWTFGGSPPAPLDFDSVDARITDDVGATDVVPLVVDGAVLFIRKKGSGARALIPQASDTPYQGADISTIARHLFVGKNRTVVDWAYAEDPWGVIWAVRSDGKMLSLTFDREQKMAAWSRHETDGSFEAVCSVPEGEEDAVYVVVTRTIAGETRRFIERLTSRVRRVLEADAAPTFTTTPEITDTDSLYPTDVCLDCAFTYVGPVTATISDPKLLNLLGESVYVIARGSPVLGPYVVFDDGGGNGSVDIDFDELPATNAVDDANAPIWVAHVGLGYTCDLETLAIRGPATAQQKTIKDVAFELDNARGVQTGQDFDNLDNWEQRTTADAYNPISAESTLLYVTPRNAWDKDARACLRQSLPLPVTVVGITRGVVGSDD